MALLDEDAIVRALDDLQWERDGASFTRTVRFADFAAALAYVNAVGALAEAADHHPDIDIRWNTVTLVLSTHSEGGLTDKDVTLAAAIDQIAT